MKKDPYRYISYPEKITPDISKKNIDQIEISFTQKGYDSWGRFGYMYGWIDVTFRWGNNRVVINTSDVYSPYKSLIKWIENMREGKLPCQLEIDDECDIIMLKAYSVEINELFYLIIENTYDQKNKICLEGLFHKQQFITEFYQKFIHFVTTEYSYDFWTSNENEKDLRELILSKSDNSYKEDTKYTCPCCGYKTLTDSGYYDLCPICYWEDDPTQLENPDLEGGPNAPSLRQAQLNFILYGACDQECLSYVRPPNPSDVHDPAWLPLCQIQENILTLQREFEKNRDLLVNLFKSASFLFFKDKLCRYKNAKRDIRRLNMEFQEDCYKVRSDALGKITDERIRYWLLKAESTNEVEFIVKAQDSFWKWLEKVKICSHLHLELITESNGFAPLYNCRYCGAYIGCTCFFRNSWPTNQYTTVRPSAISDFIPYPVFKEIFIKPNMCYRCRKDEDLAAACAYGKNKIEKIYWRELFAEESKAWTLLKGKEFQTMDEMLRYTKSIRSISQHIRILLHDDKDKVIERIFERALCVRNRMRKMGMSASIKEMVKYTIDKFCCSYDNQYKFDEKNYFIKNKSGFYSSKTIIGEPGYLKNSDKIRNIPLIFKIDILKDFLIEETAVNEKDVKTLAMSYVQTFQFDPAYEFHRAFEAARIKDVYLFLKTTQKIWQKARIFLIAQKDALLNIITDNGIEWAVMEYKLFCGKNRSGFEMGLKRDEGYSEWLNEVFLVPDLMSMLREGKIITNIVGMRYIKWEKYLKLDEYLDDKRVHLVRELDNQYDENAIAVQLNNFGKLGYIKRSVAKMLAPNIDKGMNLHAEIFARYYACQDIDSTIFLRIKADV